MIPTRNAAFLVDRIGWLLIHSLWQYALIALVMMAVLRMMRRRTAIARYATCLVALAAIVIAPAATWQLLPAPTPAQTTVVSNPLVTWEPVLDDADPLAPTNTTATPLTHDAARLPSAAAPPETVATPHAVTPVATVAAAPVVRWWAPLDAAISPWLEELVAIWCLGVLLFAIRPAWSWCLLRRLRRVGVSAVPQAVQAALVETAQRLGVRREVRLLQSTLVSVPMVVGYLRPVILLPLCVVSGFSTSEMQAILAHELAHIRRHDYLANLLQTLIETVCFYHPTVWWLSSRVRQEREHCCDELAAHALGSRAAYGRALLALEELRGTSPVLSLGANSGSLLERIRRLAAAETSPQTVGAGGVVMVALSIVMLIGIGVWTATHADDVSVTAARNVNDESEEQGLLSPPPAGVVQGILVNAADGAPVAGARIILRGSRVFDGESDTEGRFQFDGVPPNARQYEIWAYVGNLITAKVQPDQTISEDSESARFARLRMEMREGKRAKFVVTSAVTKRPLEGAVIRFGYPDRRKTTTAADGTAVVEGFLSQEYDVTIEAEGHARQAPQLDLSQSDKDAEYRLALDPGGIVRGTIVDEQGDPVPQAQVVYRETENNIWFYGDAFRTDAEGRFQHRFLPLDSPIKVSVRHDDYDPQVREVVLAAEKREAVLRITLPKRPSKNALIGIVMDSQGSPVTGAQVANYGNRGSAQCETLTDEEGKFALDDLLEGYTAFRIVVTAKGFAPAKLSVEPGTAETPGSVNVTLTPGHGVRGRVVDEHGRPAEGAFVTPRSPAYPFQGVKQIVRTGKDGGFVFDSLPGEAVFDVFMPGYARMSRLSLPLDGDELITMALEAPGVIRGRVVDAETGEPLRQFRVRVGFSRTRIPGDPKGSYSGNWGNPGLTFSSDKGEFLISPITNGMPLELTVLAEDYERFVIPRAVAARSGQSKELTVSLKRMDTSERFTLNGQFLDHAGRPAAGAQLRLIVSTNRHSGDLIAKPNWALIKSGQLAQKSDCEQLLSGVTDADGRFEFKNILSGKHLSLAYWGDGVPQGRFLDFDKTRPGGSESATIKLPNPAQIRGKIERSRFPDAGSVSLILQHDGAPEFKLKLDDEQGSFAFDDLPPGEYLVVVLAEPVEVIRDGSTLYRANPLAQQKIQLKPGETKAVLFREPNIKQQ